MAGEAGHGPDRPALARRAAVAGGLVALVAGSWWHKTLCLTGRDTDWLDTHWCFTDVTYLYALRGLDADLLPYAPATGVTWEYPPGMALPAWGIARLVDSAGGFLGLTALTMAVAILVTAWALERASRALGRPTVRVPLILLSPAVLLFAVQNWDLWSVAPVALGLWAAARHRPVRAGVWFGLGAAVKWWPALLVPTLLAGPWAPAGRGTRRLAPVAGAAAAWAVVQVPALFVSPEGWWAAVAFHLDRPPNPDGHWGAIAGLGARLVPGGFWEAGYLTAVDAIAVVGTAAGVGYVTWRLATDRSDPGDAALALVAVLLLASKVFSFQFVLWLLPVGVVATVPVRRVVTVEVLGCLVWILYAPWDGVRDPLLVASQVTALVRAAAVGWVLAGALRARPPSRRVAAAQPVAHGA